MNKIVMAAIALVVTTSFVHAGSETYSFGEPKSSAAMAKAMLRTQGGFLKKPGSFEGKIVVVDGRKEANTKELAEALEKLAVQQGFRVEVRAQKVDIAKARSAIESCGAKVGVVVVDDDASPSLSVFPDEGYAVMNAKKVVVGVERSRLASIRVKKQLLRAFGYVCGGMSSQYEGTLCAPVQKFSDLDAMPQELPMDVVFAFRKYLAPYGITPYVRTTYRRACQEGWAPAATNEFQKKIWSEIRTLPTKPLQLTK